MSDNLDLHEASADERAQAFRNVHDVWPVDPDPEEHLRRRLANPKYANATWYVGTLDGRVVAACGCYHVSVCIDGAVEPACAVGAVHTLPEFRGRGFAPRVLAFAESQEREAGKTFSLLYSDISPAYYERLGYRRCAAAQGWLNPAESKAERPVMCELRQFQAAEELSTLIDLYDRAHRRFPLSIARSSRLLALLCSLKIREDEFYFVEPSGSRWAMSGWGSGLTESSYETSRCWTTMMNERDLYSAVIALAKERGAERVGGWMPADAVCRELFEVTDRVKELTMIKPLVDRIKIDERHCLAAQHFHEIDHV